MNQVRRKVNLSASLGLLHFPPQTTEKSKDKAQYFMWNNLRSSNHNESTKVFGTLKTHASKVVHVVILERAGGRRRGRQRVFGRLGALQYVPASQAEPQLCAELRLVDSGQLVGPQQALAHVTQRDVDGDRGRAAELRADGMAEILWTERRRERRTWVNDPRVWLEDG